MKELSQKEKAGIYLRIKQNPTIGLFQAFEALRAEMLDMMEAKLGAIKGEIGQESLLKGISQLKGEKGNPGDPGKPGRTPQKGTDYFTSEEIEDITKKVLKMGLERIKGDPGDPGKTPKKGTDYFTSTEISEMIHKVLSMIEVPKPKNGKSPIAGIDYPTHNQVIEVIKDEVVKMKQDHKKPQEMDMGVIVQKMMDEMMTNKHMEMVARALESLSYEKKLDYNYALKNTPGIKLYDEKRGAKRLARGTGSAVKVYDISSQLNGVLKTFTIPTNIRVLAVHFSSFPFSSSRPTTDYTSTSTSITFTSEIDAATTLAAGQSALIEYVEA